MAGANGMKSIAFNMSPNTAAGAYYIDNVVFEVEKENAGGGIPLTPQEKKDTLLYAMDKWIHGMMDACRDEEGNLLVKAWEAVNEPIGANGQLQHGNADDKDNFFWQDYLGDLDYVRTVVKLAHKYGGDDIKLFVNDYNLEYDSSHLSVGLISGNLMALLRLMVSVHRCTSLAMLTLRRLQRERI